MDYQCLPLNPQFDRYTVSRGTVSWIYGAEYQIEGCTSNIPASAHQQNVPCARCYSHRSAMMMLPARHDCPSGWTREYHGMVANYLQCCGYPSSASPSVPEEAKLKHRLQTLLRAIWDIGLCPIFLFTVLWPMLRGMTEFMILVSTESHSQFCETMSLASLYFGASWPPTRKDMVKGV